MPISGIAQESFEAKDLVAIIIQFNIYRERLNCIVLPKITQRLPQNFIHLLRLKIPSNIRLVDSQFNVPSDIDLPIGAELF